MTTTNTADFFGNGIRIWHNGKMLYLKDRYTLCYPPYRKTFASVYSPKTLKIANETFMICVEKDKSQPNGGIYEGDIITFLYKGVTGKGEVIYNAEHACWSVKYDEKEIPYYKAHCKKVVGNIYEA